MLDLTQKRCCALNLILVFVHDLKAQLGLFKLHLLSLEVSFSHRVVLLQLLQLLFELFFSGRDCLQLGFQNVLNNFFTRSHQFVEPLYFFLNVLQFLHALTMNLVFLQARLLKFFL